MKNPLEGWLVLVVGDPDETHQNLVALNQHGWVGSWIQTNSIALATQLAIRTPTALIITDFGMADGSAVTLMRQTHCPLIVVSNMVMGDLITANGGPVMPWVWALVRSGRNELPAIAELVITAYNREHKGVNS